MKYYILFNPLAGNGSCKEKLNRLVLDKTANTVYCDVTDSDSYKDLLCGLSQDDRIIVCGGDGTLNRFVNGTNDIDIKNEILYFAAGSGNDFLHDLGLKPDKEPIVVNEYIKDLPVLTVEGKNYRFINGVGFGLDGFACAECNRLRQEKGKDASYIKVAFKGILKAYSPVNAKAVVDGEEHHYKRVWMASCMKGKFFGGGIKIAPDQDRKSEKKEITSIIVHNLSRFKIITIFPSVFRGTHIKYKKFVAVNKGSSVRVEFDRPVDLQIDGETVAKVSAYSVRLPKTAKV